MFLFLLLIVRYASMDSISQARSVGGLVLQVAGVSTALPRVAFQIIFKGFSFLYHPNKVGSCNEGLDTCDISPLQKTTVGSSVVPFDLGIAIQL